MSDRPFVTIQRHLCLRYHLPLRFPQSGAAGRCMQWFIARLIPTGCHSVLRRILAIAVLLSLIPAATVWSLQNPSVVDPIGPGTVPPSTFESGLIHTPSPTDTSGNLIVTGNVREGKHFLGSIPYRSTTSFAAPLGSSSLDSFLRYSTGSEYIGHYGEGFIPFYSPTATVSTISLGYYDKIPERATMRINSRISLDSAEAFAGAGDVLLDTTGGADLVSAAPQPEAISSPDSVAGQNLLWPILPGPIRAQAHAPDQPSKVPRSELLTEQEYQKQMDQLRQELLDIGDSSQRRPSPEQRDERFSPEQTSLAPPKATPEASQFETGLLKEPSHAEEQEGIDALDEQLDFDAQTRRQIDALEALQEQEYIEPEPTKTKLRVWEPEWLDALKDSLPGAEAVAERKEQSYEGESHLEKPKSEAELIEQDSEPTESALQQLSRLSDAEISARAKQILGTHENLASFSHHRFNQYFKAGQTYLKQGRYLQAENAFALASMYKPDSPLAYAGRSQALFAVGQYISSALFLTRTLKIYPQYAELKVDLAGIMGGQDKLNNRIADAQECLQLSGAAELQFLLSYIYLQLNKLDEAKQAIDKACKQMSDVPAVQTLKKVIDKALRGTG